MELVEVYSIYPVVSRTVGKVVL